MRKRKVDKIAMAAEGRIDVVERERMHAVD
jgi:hypothetical protein